MARAIDRVNNPQQATPLRSSFSSFVSSSLFSSSIHPHLLSSSQLSSLVFSHFESTKTLFISTVFTPHSTTLFHFLFYRVPADSMLQTPCSLTFPEAQPRPRFCIFRPGGYLAPLIPADELPSWLHLGNFDPDLVAGLHPVSLTHIPREGEYDVICHNCSSSIDSLHQSNSERNSDSQSPRSSTSQTQNFSGGFFTRAADCQVPAVVPPVSVVAQSPVPAAVQIPFPGMYMLQMPVISSNVLPSVMRTPAAMEKARDIASTCSHIGSDLFEKGYTQGKQQSSGSDADSEGSDAPSEKTILPDPAKQVDSPDPRVDHVSSPNSRTGFDAAAELESRIQKPTPDEDDQDAMTILTQSIASTRSLTAAVIRLGKLMAEGKIRRPSNFDLAQVHRTGFESDSVARPRASSNVYVTPSKRVRVRRRHRRANKPAKSKADAPKVNEEPQHEQQNSSTKRRERREKQNRGKKNTGGPSRFAHMTASQNRPEHPRR